MNRQAIIDDVRQGASLAQVAKKTGINRMTISNLVLEAYETGELTVPAHRTVQEGLAMRKKVRAYVEERGVFTVDDACADLHISIPTLNRHLRGLGFAGRVLPKTPGNVWRRWSDEQILAALRDIWDEARDDGAVYLSVEDYNRRREGREFPSVSAVTGRFVSWPEACFEAGVPCGSAGKVWDWSPDDLLAALEQFYAETGERTMAAYNRWSRGKDVPSSGHIHKRTGSWNEALNWVVEKAWADASPR
jgi:hypothetical protein